MRINCAPEEGNKACCQAVQNHHKCCNYICCPHQDAHHPEGCTFVFVASDSVPNLLH